MNLVYWARGKSMCQLYDCFLLPYGIWKPRWHWRVCHRSGTYTHLTVRIWWIFINYNNEMGFSYALQSEKSEKIHLCCKQTPYVIYKWQAMLSTWETLHSPCQSSEKLSKLCCRYINCINCIGCCHKIYSHVEMSRINLDQRLVVVREHKMKW